MSEVTAFVGRTAEGDRVYVTLSVEKFDRTVQTVNHETVTGGVRLSASGFVIPKGRREADQGGQCVYRAADVTDSTGSAWTVKDRASLVLLWNRWHLNDMRAACAHMTLPKDESYDARKGIMCDRVIVLRHGNPVSPVLRDRDEAFTWILKHQPMSVDWAMQYEGYAIGAAHIYGHAWLYEEPPADVIMEWERLKTLPTGKVPTNY